MKRFIEVLAVTLMSLSLLACSSDKPAEVSQKFVKELVAGNSEGAMELSTIESHALIGLMELSGANIFPENLDMEVVKEQIDGDQALVKLKDKASGKNLKLKLYKREGDWKVHFNKY